MKTFRSLPQDMDARINHVVTDQNGEKAALIKIVTGERGFEFEGGMLGIVKTEQKTGEIWVYIPRAAKKITIKHADLGVLRNYLYPESIKEASVYEMVLVSGKVTTIVEDLEIAAQWLVVQTEPAGATFYIDGKEIGETPLNRKYKEGTYDYRIQYPRHHPVIGKLEIANEKKEISHVLKPKFGDVYVSSEPEDGMEVFVNGKASGKTTPVLLTGIDSGNQEIGLKSKWYQNQTKTILIEDETQTDVAFTMMPAFADVSIVSTEGAEIQISGQKRGVREWNGRLLVGIYEVNVQKAHYQTRNKQLDVQSGKAISLDLSLTPQTGNVDIISKPIGAEIFVDGNAYGKTPNTISDLICGEHELQLTFDGYATHRQVFEILQNKTIVIDTVLRSATQVLIESSPKGAEVFIDEVFQGKTPLQLELGFGAYPLLIRNGTITQRGTIQVEMDSENTFFADVRSEADKREMALWEKAERADKLSMYQTYLNAYPNGRYQSDAELKISNLRSRLDDAMFEKANSSNKLADYEIYVDSFPNGKHIKSVHEVLENSYYVLGNEAFDEKNYSLTQFYFNKYMAAYPNTERSSEVMKKLNKANNRLNRPDNTYLMYNFDTESEIGFSLGGLKQKGMGTYYAVKCNFDWILTGSQVLHTKSEYEFLYSDAEYTGRKRKGNVAISAGVTYPIIYPLWVYGGMGLGYYPQYELYSSEMVSDEWVRNENNSEGGYFYEAGFMLNIGRNYTVKYGMLLGRNFVHQFGVAFRF
ncbi:MAG: PEGA domain-containing protein [Bacteroidales bacterium]|nr:PEGA domain-containing protein [Bacteroidales bacterium]